jgi:hypothetical protein
LFYGVEKYFSRRQNAGMNGPRNPISQEEAGKHLLLGRGWLLLAVMLLAFSPWRDGGPGTLFLAVAIGACTGFGIAGPRFKWHGLLIGAAIPVLFVHGCDGLAGFLKGF